MLTDHVLPYKKESHFETSKTPPFLIPFMIKYIPFGTNHTELCIKI